MRRRTLYVCALVLVAVTALYFPLVGSTATRGQGSDVASKKRELSNFDALAASKRNATPGVESATGAAESADVQFGEEARLPMEAGHVVQMETRLGVPTFLWATNSGKARTLSARAETRRADATSAAFEHVGAYASRYRLSGTDIAALQVASVHDTGKGAIVVKFKQSIGGIEVFREEMNIIMNRSLQLVAISGYLTGGSDTISVDAAAAGSKLTKAQAVASAVGNITGSAVSPTAMRSAANPSAKVGATGGSEYSYFTFAAIGEAQMGTPARVKQVMYHGVDGYVPAYYVEAEVLVPGDDEATASIDGSAAATESHSYSFVISALDGQLLFRKNLTEKDAFTYRVWADTSGDYVPFDGPQGKVGPYPTAGLSGYEAPFVPMNDVTLQNSPFSQNDPWLPAGAVETTGNNVDAYADIAGTDGFTASTADFRAPVTAPGQFLHTFDPNALPNTTPQQSAAITQLFFDNNFLHDWFYDSGFNEAAGNAQTDNFGRGGLGGDSIKAEAQDFSGRNNANMNTPADGGRPTMQMYVFSGLSYINVLSPAPPSGLRSGGTWQLGPQFFDYTGNIFVPPTPSGCTAAEYGGGGSGKIALVNRQAEGVGTACSLGTKLNVAVAAGATGLIIVNNSSTPNTGLNVTGFLPGYTIPLLNISWNGAASIKTSVAGGNTVSTRMFRAPDSDGTIDNQIVAHEWGHYISNRLISNSAGLTNNQGRSMGEGWGDFVSMLITVREGDDLKPNNAEFSGAYGMAAYATGHNALLESYWFGIRRVAYSTDMTKNALTFKHIDDSKALPNTAPLLPNGVANSEVHNSGEVWTTMLWECYASLLRDTGRLTFAEAQDRMKGYLVASLKMTPPSPTFLEARDAVLAAAYASDPVDGDLFAQAFAKRGAGANAIAPDRFSDNHAGVVESYEIGSNLSFVNASFADDLVSCDTDGYLDNNEKGTLSITLKNTGSQALSNTVATVTSSNAGVNFPTGNVATFSSSDPLDQVTATVVVEGKNLSGIQASDYTITFSDANSANGLSGTAHHYAKLNVDEAPATSKNEDFESKVPAWTTGFNPALPNFGPWKKSNVGADYVMHGDDYGSSSDQYLISPSLNVSATGSLGISFLHRHSFEAPDWDGGRLEISTNGGTSWTPIGTTPAFYNGTIRPANAANVLTNQPGFIGQNTGYPNFITSTLDLGTAYQGQTVKIRFRLASDGAAGAAGWDVASFNVTGIDNTPFTTLVADPGPCGAVVTLELNPGTLPEATVKSAYSVVLNAAGGTGPYTYDAPTGLPAGLTSAPFGAGLKISGTPTEAGSFPISIGYHDNAAHNGTANYTLVVNKGAAIIALSNLGHIYDGTAKAATATTNPAGLDTVTITYSQNGNPVASPTNAGTYDVLAQLNNPDYAAPDKTGTLVIAKAPQTIDFQPLANKVFKDPAFTISATATSGLPVKFTRLSGPATISGGNTVTLTGAGTVKIRASQAGDSNYKAAPVIDQTFTVEKATTTLNVTKLSQVYNGTARNVVVATSPTGLSGVTVVYKQGGVGVTPINAGSYDVEVTLNNPNYQATPVNTTLVITKANQVINFPVIGTKSLAAGTFNLVASATSGLPLTFEIVSGPSNVSGNTVTMTGTGIVRVRAKQAGDSNYNAASPIERSFTIKP